MPTYSALVGTVLQNSGGSGGSARAGNGRDRFASDILGANKKAAVFIAYGFSDARYTAATATFNVAQYQNDYRELLNGLILGGYARGDIYVASPYMISDTGLMTGSAGFTGQSRSGYEACVAAAASVAVEFGTNYCDLYAATNTAAFIADTDANDHIHPTDPGHALIAAAWATRTIAANARAAPTSVTISASATTVTVAADAVSGATSYDYTLIANSNEYASNTSGSFAGVAPGNYFARSRAAFGDGSKGPWTFSTAAASVAVPAKTAGVPVSDRAWVPTNSASIANNLTSRREHHASPQGSITNLQFIDLGWYIAMSGHVPASAGGFTIKKYIEYPAGTFTAVTWSGSATVSVGAGLQVKSDPVAITIPAGATFWERTVNVTGSAISMPVLELPAGSTIIGANDGNSTTD